MLTLDLVVLGCTIMNYILGQMMVVFVAKVLLINGLVKHYYLITTGVPVTIVRFLLLFFMEKAQYEEAMENKYGPNWKVEHPNFDASVIYEYVGRMSHGKLGIADEAITIAEKESIKTRKRSAQPHASAREKRLERENEKLRKENSVLSEVQRVVRVIM